MHCASNLLNLTFFYLGKVCFSPNQLRLFCSWNLIAACFYDPVVCNTTTSTSNFTMTSADWGNPMIPLDQPQLETSGKTGFNPPQLITAGQGSYPNKMKYRTLSTPGHGTSFIQQLQHMTAGQGSCSNQPKNKIMGGETGFKKPEQYPIVTSRQSFIHPQQPEMVAAAVRASFGQSQQLSTTVGITGYEQQQQVLTASLQASLRSLQFWQSVQNAEMSR